jgi:hypothetical protein
VAYCVVDLDATARGMGGAVEIFSRSVSIV